MEPRFGILGALEVRDTSGSPVPLGGQKPRELLAALLLHRGQILSVDRLVDMLWGETATSGAATTLRTYVGQVRQILARAEVPASLENRSGGYSLELDADVLDAELFERLVGEGRQLDRALELWRGEVLADLGHPEFATAAVTRLEELRLVAWEGWIDSQLAAGQHRAVVTRLQALVDAHPFRERFSAQLMLALYRSGRQADALAVSAATRLRLSEELGLDPGPELRELETSMLQQAPHLDASEHSGTPERWLDAVDVGNGSRSEAHAARSLAEGRMELLEREYERTRLADLISAAAEGRGSGVAVSGAAGTGKSTLVQVACADGPRVRVLRGYCDPLSTPRPFGPLRDIAVAAGFQTLVGGEELLIPQVCEEVHAALSREPTVLVVEDIHWVDAATADVLRFLARRVATMPLAVLVTYRDHEVGPRHPARQLLGDMASLDHLDTLTLKPLSELGVRRMVAGSDLDPAQVHAVTGGNPFFVTEIVKEPDRPLPSSVRDAVLARTAEVTPEDFEVLQLVACAPDRLDERVLPTLGVDLSSLRRLEDTGLLSRSRGGLAYRHELARQAVESTIPAGGESDLHRRLLDALERADVLEPAVLTHHAVAARDAERVLLYARLAADEAVRAGAHTEAVAFLQIALDHLRDDAVRERADLLKRLSFEQYLTERLTEAIDTVRAAIPLWQQAGDDAGLASAHETAGVFQYYNACRAEAETSVDTANGIAVDTGALAQQASATTTRGFLAYLRNDAEFAAALSGDAARIAQQVDDDFLRLRAELVQILATLVTGDDSVRAALDDNIRTARARGWDELASTGYSQLAFQDVEHRRLDRADSVLSVSLPFAAERDIPICSHWQTSVRARVSYQRGQWDAALADAEVALDREGMAVAKLWPHLLSALVPLRRHGTVDERSLAAAWTLACTIDEPLRRLPLYSAYAEVMWMTGLEDERVTRDALAMLEQVAGLPGSEWAVGELVAWLNRLGIHAAVAPVAAPHQAATEGRVDEAAGWWERNGEPFAAAMVLGDSTDLSHRTRATALLEGLGAHATADRVRAHAPRAVTA